MKNIFYFVMLLCVALFPISCNTHKHSSALKDGVNEDEIFYEPELQPHYLHGGNEGLLNDLYTTMLKTAPVRDSISKRALVVFKINKHGLIDHNTIKIFTNRSSIPDDYMSAAIEAIKHLGKFEPGKLNGTPVSVRYNLPIIYPIPKEFIKTK